jgi:uncharacterized membrane protein YqiK
MNKKILWSILTVIVLVCVGIFAVRLLKPAEELDSMIRVQSPTSGQSVQSPLMITGQARGTWFFEASFPVRLVDKAGVEIAAGIATAQSDWMTEDFVPFTASLIFASDKEQEAELILIKDNPSILV